MFSAESNVTAGALRVTITNGGPHTADTMAEATLKSLLEIVPSDSDGRAISAMQLRDYIYEILYGCYRIIETNERNFDVAKAVDLVMAAGMDSPWLDLFGKQRMQIAIALNRDFETARMMHRDWRKFD